MYTRMNRFYISSIITHIGKREGYFILADLAKVFHGLPYYIAIEESPKGFSDRNSVDET